MGNTSNTARALLAAILRGDPWPRAELQKLIEGEAPELFSIVAEGLADQFEPRLAQPYAEMFAEVIASAIPEFDPADLVARYHRIRHPRQLTGDPSTVFVLSRVTLGADIAITSVILDGLKRRLPRARIVFAGPRKSYELFAADPRIEHLPISYARRIAIPVELNEPGSIVVDPDSRITQLGLLPVCPEESYYFFDTHAWEGSESLGCMARNWVAQTFGVPDARAYIAPAEHPEGAAIAVSLGVGGNPAKRVEDPFESELLKALAAKADVIVDAGAGGEEAARVRRAIGNLPIRTWQGSFAGFASIIGRSRLYAGYDSAGQHAAAACGVPVVTVFAGAPNERFRQRWRPTGPGPVEIVAAGPRVLEDTLAAVDRLFTAA
ncbi:MAG: hypothetical protein ACM336_18965 [Acidobacteriota bacterium]